MIHIFFLARSLHIGGSERQLVNLVKYLDKSKYDTTVACFYGGGVLEQELRGGGIRLLDLKKKGRWDILIFIFRLVKILRKLKPDILYSWLDGPNILGFIAGYLSKVPKVIWGIRASNVDLKKYGIGLQISFWMQTRLSRYIDLIIANSESGKKYHIARGFPAKKIVIVPNGINVNHFCPLYSEGVKVKKEWNIKANEILIGLVGRLDPMKDHPTFMEAVSMLCKKRTDVKFICVGDGEEPYKSDLYQLSKKLELGGKLIWAGRRLDMAAVYNALDISSSSSSGEGFPNVIGESMACGVPCVVTDVGDSAKIVGDTGIIVPPKSPDMLAKGWEQLLNLEKKEFSLLSRRVRERIVNNYSVGKMIERHNEFFEDILKDI